MVVDGSNFAFQVESQDKQKIVTKWTTHPRISDLYEGKNNILKKSDTLQKYIDNNCTSLSGVTHHTHVPKRLSHIPLRIKIFNVSLQ